MGQFSLNFVSATGLHSAPVPPTPFIVEPLCSPAFTPLSTTSPAIGASAGRSSKLTQSKYLNFGNDFKALNAELLLSPPRSLFFWHGPLSGRPRWTVSLWIWIHCYFPKLCIWAGHKPELGCEQPCQQLSLMACGDRRTSCCMNVEWNHFGEEEWVEAEWRLCVRDQSFLFWLCSGSAQQGAGMH